MIQDLKDSNMNTEWLSNDLFHAVYGQIDYLTDYIRLQKWTGSKNENRFVDTTL